MSQILDDGFVRKVIEKSGDPEALKWFDEHLEAQNKAIKEEYRQMIKDGLISSEDVDVDEMELEKMYEEESDEEEDDYIPLGVPIENNEINSVRTDGLYSYIYKESSRFTINDVLRFYEDGTVISAAVAQTRPEDSCFPQLSWFDKDKEGNYCSGSWTREGNNIEICIEVPEVNDIELSLDGPKRTVIYKGIIFRDSLYIGVFSEETEHVEEKDEYLFFPFDEIQGWSDTAEK